MSIFKASAEGHTDMNVKSIEGSRSSVEKETTHYSRKAACGLNIYFCVWREIRQNCV